MRRGKERWYSATIMELGKSSHGVYKIRYHLVTAVKYRKAILNKDVEECLMEILKGISERYEIIIDEVGFDQNHIHIFCAAPPRIAPLRIVTTIKSITVRKIFEKFPKLTKEELWGGEFWSDGKYIGPVGEATSESTIRRYIKNQSLDKGDCESRIKQLKLFNM